MKQEELKILIAGEGGQGVQTIGEILARAAFYNGYFSTYIPNFGVEQRGGVSLAFVIINKKHSPVFPKFDKADILVALSQRSLERIERYFGKNTIFIWEKAMVESKKGIGIEAIKLAQEKLIPKVFNMVIFGVLTNFVSLSSKAVEKALEDVLGKKFKENIQLKKLNLKAIEAGKELLK